MYVLRDELPENDKSAITFDNDAATATIHTQNHESAGDYHIGIAIVDKVTAER